MAQFWLSEQVEVQKSTERFIEKKKVQYTDFSYPNSLGNVPQIQLFTIIHTFSPLKHSYWTYTDWYPHKQEIPLCML